MGGRRLGIVVVLLGLLALTGIGWSVLRTTGRAELPRTPTPATAEDRGFWRAEAWQVVVDLNQAAVLYAPSGDLYLVAPYLELTGPAYQEFKVAQQERADQGILRRSALRVGPLQRSTWQEGNAVFVETSETWDEVGYRAKTGEIVYVVTGATSVQRYELRRGADGQLKIWAIEEVH